MNYPASIPNLRPAMPLTDEMDYDPGAVVAANPESPLSPYFHEVINRLNINYRDRFILVGGFVRDELLFGQAELSHDIDAVMSLSKSVVRLYGSTSPKLSHLNTTSLTGAAVTTPFTPLTPAQDKKLHLLPVSVYGRDLHGFVQQARINLCQVGFDPRTMQFLVTGNALIDWANREITTDIENCEKVESYLERPHFRKAGFRTNYNEIDEMQSILAEMEDNGGINFGK